MSLHENIHYYINLRKFYSDKKETMRNLFFMNPKEYALRFKYVNRKYVLPIGGRSRERERKNFKN